MHADDGVAIDDAKLVEIGKDHEGALGTVMRNRIASRSKRT